jgi:hypothetical protein
LDRRFQWYLGDSWKIKPNFTLTYGLRYNRDTGRSDSDLGSIPCSAVTGAFSPCTGSTPLLNQWGVDEQGTPLGTPIKQPNTQFGPQFGFAWDPMKNGKTVIRGGAGIYYENSIFNNTLFDRPAKLAQGLFFSSPGLTCNGPGASFLTIPGQGNVTTVQGKDIGTDICDAPVSTAAPLTAALQQELQAAVKAQGPTANPSYVANPGGPGFLNISVANLGLSAFDPNFRNARSYQFNFGIQRELVKGGVLTADYIRNVSTRFMLTIDANRVGDARFLNVPAAQAAITKTLAACGIASVNSIGTICPSGTIVDASGAPRALNITDFAANGLDSGDALGFAPSTLSGAAFGGINPNVGEGDFEVPEGRSVYNALQVSYKQSKANPMPGFASGDVVIAYTLSRFVGDGGNDQNFSANAWDNNNPGYFTGPTSLDRTDQFKFGLTGQISHRGPRISVIGNFATPAPSTMLLSTQGVNTKSSGEIFRTDLTGDGTVGDIFPTSGCGSGLPGNFMRSTTPQGLTNVVSNWNSTCAGTLTPAGQALVSAGLFTTAQLQQLQATKPYVAQPPAGAVGNGVFREVSTVLAWPIKITERFSLEPSVSAFNVFNLANFGRLDGHLGTQFAPFTPGQIGGGGTVNGTASGALRESSRIGIGSGIFNLASPRQLEYGVRLNF